MTPQELLGWVAQNGVWVYGLLLAYCVGKTGSLPLVAGFLAGSGSLNVALVGGAAMVGSVGGGQLRFWMGRKGAPWLYARYPGIGRWVALGSVAVDHYSGPLLPTYRFAKGTFSLVGVGAGASTLGWPRFAALDVTGALLWACVMVGMATGWACWAE